MVRDTSIYAYRDVTSDGTAISQRDKVLNALKGFPPGLTRENIRDVCSIMYSSVCGRVNELLKMERIYEEGFKINDSGKKAHVLKAYHPIYAEDRL